LGRGNCRLVPGQRPRAQDGRVTDGRLAQFQQYVADGQVRYFLVGNGHGGRGGPHENRAGAGKDITSWVAQNFAKSDVDGTTVYDLESPRFSTSAGG
jgi:hypothetical protein